jgi:hypothetical protein
MMEGFRGGTHDAMVGDSDARRPILGPRETEVLMAWLRADGKDEVARALQSPRRRFVANWREFGRNAPPSGVRPTRKQPSSHA